MMRCFPSSGFLVLSAVAESPNGCQRKGRERTWACRLLLSMENSLFQSAGDANLELLEAAHSLKKNEQLDLSLFYLLIQKHTNHSKNPNSLLRSQFNIEFE